MKKIFTFICILSMSVASMAAKADADRIYKKLKAEHEETFSMSLSKNMIDFFDMDLDFNGKEKLIKGDFHEGRMLVMKNTSSTSSIVKLFKTEHYEMLKVEDEHHQAGKGAVYLFVDKRGKKVSEAHFVVVDEEDVVVLSVFGNITVQNK